MILNILLSLVIIVLVVYIYMLKKKETLITISSNQVPDSDSPICMNYGASINKIPADSIMAIIKKYKDNQLESINNDHRSATHFANKVSDTSYSGHSDTTSIYFELEVLKKFIYNLESKAKGHNILDPNLLGLRMYYSAYPDNKMNSWNTQQHACFRNLPPSYANRHTLVIIPIKRMDSNSEFHDFDVINNRLLTDTIGNEQLNTNIENRKPNLTDKYIEQQTEIAALGITTPQTTVVSHAAQNHGGLIRPDGNNGIAFVQ